MSDKPNIHDMAKWFLDKEPMSQKKLQKLCYYAVAWGYTLLNDPLIKDPEFEAWVHGPVSKTLWNTYKPYGWEPINNKSTGWKRLVHQMLSGKEFDANKQELLEAVWITYGSKSGLELEALSHKETPWIKARNGLDESTLSSTPISPDDMKDYYKSIYISS
jgi:uncharacterized phage-associated protein